MSTPLDSNLTRAVQTLRSGGVVGMPTETVYGLAADARSSEAVAKIFALKGRPSTNPLIVHVASIDIGERYAVFDDRARKLFSRFAPGALTVVLPLQSRTVLGPEYRCGDAPPLIHGILSHLVSAGLNTVGIRIPNHPVALELLRAFDGPLAAPSANKSNHVSPTTAQHVRDEFGADLLVLDGGPCRVGIESTVLDLSRATPTILRPGEITREQIEAVIGPVRLFAGNIDISTSAASPGQHRVHYAPRAPAYRFESELDLPTDAASQRVGLLVYRERDSYSLSTTLVKVLGDSPEVANARFYSALRELDAERPAAIYIEMPPDEPRWVALRDRITRATQPVPGRR